jgi:hypothetical protein
MFLPCLPIYPPSHPLSYSPTHPPNHTHSTDASEAMSAGYDKSMGSQCGTYAVRQCVLLLSSVPVAGDCNGTHVCLHEYCSSAICAVRVVLQYYCTVTVLLRSTTAARAPTPLLTNDCRFLTMSLSPHSPVCHCHPPVYIYWLWLC